MDPEKQKKCDIILKLLNLGDAEKNSNPAEREVAMQKAAKLMAEWAIDFVDLKTRKPKSDAFIRVDVDGTDSEKVDWEATLAGGVCRAFDCRIVHTGVERYSKWRMAFMGSKTDVEISVFFFKYLRRTVDKLGDINVKEAAYGSLRQAKRNYRFGMVATLCERLKALYKMREEHIPTDCKALMVVKKDGLVNYVKDQFPRLRKSGSIKLTGDMGAYHNGKQDGHSINLNRPLSGSSAPAALLGK